MQMQRFREASGDMSRRLALLRTPESGAAVTKLASN
jgi:hypothetical protein